ncbi:MAG: hypothetical protein H7061_13510 [Bdellovibrionaceae bacterium]|nr:hypothetical protein [Bdellovibrio sp.]
MVFLMAANEAHARVAGIDLRMKRFGFFTGVGRGEYKGSDPYYDVKFATTPSIYGLTLAGGKFSRLWSFTATRSNFYLQNRDRITFSTMATYSIRLGQINEKQNYFFLGTSLRTLSFSRELSIDGEILYSTPVTMLLPGILLTYQHHITKGSLIFSQLIVDFPVYYTVLANPDQSNQVNARLNIGALVELSQHWSFHAESQLSMNRSSTMNGPDKTFHTLYEGSLLTGLFYLF